MNISRKTEHLVKVLNSMQDLCEDTETRNKIKEKCLEVLMIFSDINEAYSDEMLGAY